MNKLQLIKTIIMIVAALFITGCAAWSSSMVDTSSADIGATSAQVPKKQANQIEITDQDIVDREYRFLGDISVYVNKTTIFHPTPTREMVNAKLQEKAAELGADAVTLVRYGEAGITLFSWGSLEGKGRAIRFVR